MAEKIFMKGCEAVAETAVRAGCRFFAGYPITPQNDVPEYFARRMPQVGGVFIQGESEVASANMAYGAAAAGVRSMTSSSSCGISLKSEAISWMAGARLPVVVANFQRGGPGIGSIQPGQADYNQVTRGGSNGDYHTIVLAPNSIQEAIDMIGKAFDLADEYRNPVIIAADGMLGQMMEPVVMPEAKHALTEDEIPEVKPYALTGHKNKRDRHAINSVWLKQELLENYINEYWPKYEKAERELQDWESRDLAGAEVVFVAYGSTSRIAMEAMEMLAQEGIKVGLIRPKTLWPFPVNAFKEIDFNTTKHIISVELSQGQMIYDVKLAVECKLPVSLINRVGGMLLDPQEIVDRTKKIMEVK